MLRSKISRTKTYSYRKVNQSLQEARRYYQKGAYEKAFDAFVLIYKKTAILFDDPDLSLAGQSLLTFFIECLQQSGNSCDRVYCQIEKLNKLPANSVTFNFVQMILTPLFEFIVLSLAHQENAQETLVVFRKILEHVRYAHLIPSDLEMKLMEKEN